ncbi:Hypothetical predicted protein [Cloeon dipterum]|uniref:Uncharacterized protein n=1 Tax=Cloeon dipterum TaxID=197152 RepID=A0A8S1C3N1_9INSE|nr:Hypothetical predicted protein [Cloeon dipterum]
MSEHVLHVASFFAIVSSLVLLSVFFAPWWLVNDDHHPNETFQRLGLWTACFKDANVSHTESSTQCSWIYFDDLSKHNITIPAFFTVTQALFTLCVVFLILISLPALTRYFYVLEGERSKINLLFIISGCLIFSGTIYFITIYCC